MIRKTVGQKIYSFTPDEEWTNNITIDETVTKNDVFESHNVTLTTKGKLLVCNDQSKLKSFCRKITRESYQEYLDFISKYDSNKDKWIYNIIDGYEEQEHILYQDDRIVIIPDYKWNNKDCNKLHILTLPKDKTLRSIRSLDATHIDLLQYCQKKTCEIIKSLYDIDIDTLKMYFHYAPTTWHLHIHFVHLQNLDTNSSIEYCHDLSTVIFNLSISSDYYKSVINKRI
jgi:m7GpppX diphosphatase